MAICQEDNDLFKGLESLAFIAVQRFGCWLEALQAADLVAADAWRGSLEELSVVVSGVPINRVPTSSSSPSKWGLNERGAKLLAAFRDLVAAIRSLEPDKAAAADARLRKLGLAITFTEPGAERYWGTRARVQVEGET